MATKTLSVTIRDRQGLVFDGEVVSLTSFNKKGKFDILQDHANLISVISGRLIIVHTDGITQEIALKSGVIQVIKNKVLVYLGVK